MDDVRRYAIAGMDAAALGNLLDGVDDEDEELELHAPKGEPLAC